MDFGVFMTMMREAAQQRNNSVGGDMAKADEKSTEYNSANPYK